MLQKEVLLLLLLFLAGLQFASISQAAKITPKKQTIFLSQKAKGSVVSKSKCRPDKKMTSWQKKKRGYAFSFLPKKTGNISLLVKCKKQKLRAMVVVRRALKPEDQIENLGTNLGAVNYYDGIVPFANIVLQSGEWLESVPLRVDGWPSSIPNGESASIVIAEARYPAGNYNVSWQGNGSFSVAGKNFSGTSGSGTVSLDGSSLVLLTISDTDESNPLRNISVRVSGETGFFHSSYIKSLRPYSVLRFMDWQRTNGTFADPNPILTCSNRTEDDYYSEGSRKGVSIETMVRLANLLDADPWFTIPHNAEASFIRCHAQIVRDNLDAGLLPRYEFSNETWNPAFAQYYDLQDSILGEGDAYLGLQRRVAREHVRVMGIIEDEMNGRSFVRVMASQAANSWVSEQRLSFENAANAVDELAIAPYLGLHDAFESDRASVYAGWNQGELFAELNRRLESEVRPWIESNWSVAKDYNKPLVTYEGGQHLAGLTSNTRLTNLFTNANRSIRMNTLYKNYLHLWKNLTGRALFVHFTDAGPYTEYGSWGALETPSMSLLSPKYQALLAY